MFGLRAALLAAICVSMCVETASAQLRGGSGPGAAERDRGLLGRVGARREERLNRIAPPPPAQGANPNLKQANGLGPNNPAANPASNGRLPLTPAAAARAASAASAQALNGANNSPYANRLGAGAPTPAPNPQAPATAATSAQAMQNGTAAVAASARSSYYPPAVRQAGATAPAVAPANKLPYNGPGVLIRLPRSIPGEVNYLIDDSEHLVVHSGEDMLLRLKGSYEVRFSRGVTSEGRSYGEARYTVTEGVYRFDIAAGGWELYREGEARDVERAVAEAQRRADEAQRAAVAADDELAQEPGGNAVNAPVDIQDKPQSKQPIPPPPSPTPPAAPAAEETLPAPKSILEPA